MADKVVLAYSGGLDTSVAVKWVKDKYNLDVIAVTIDVGNERDFSTIRQKALDVGAVKAEVIDAKELFVKYFVFPALQADAIYEGQYPLATALSRPLMAKLLVDVAQEEGAEAIAHGCTGKGNDQVRFDVGVKALAPELKIIAPIREWNMTRTEEIRYADEKGIPIPVKRTSPYSIDQNLFGRSIESGVLEDAYNEPPPDVYEWIVAPEKAPDKPEYLEIEFAEGKPIALNGSVMKPAKLIESLNIIAGRHGVGRIDHIEDRLVGIKSREVYECPAATVLIEAHHDLEKAVLTRHEVSFKQEVEQQWAFLIYSGLWYDPLREGWATGRYLKELYRKFRSWPLALTAYNTGPTRLKRLIRRRRTRDLGRLADKGTSRGFGFAGQNYYAQLAAVTQLTVGATFLGKAGPVSVVRVPKPMPLVKVADCLQTRMELLAGANPALTESIERPL